MVPISRENGSKTRLSDYRHYTDSTFTRNGKKRCTFYLVYEKGRFNKEVGARGLKTYLTYLFQSKAARRIAEKILLRRTISAQTAVLIKHVVQEERNNSKVVQGRSHKHGAKKKV